MFTFQRESCFPHPHCQRTKGMLSLLHPATENFTPDLRWPHLMLKVRVWLRRGGCWSALCLQMSLLWYWGTTCEEFPPRISLHPGSSSWWHLKTCLWLPHQQTSVFIPLVKSGKEMSCQWIQPKYVPLVRVDSSEKILQELKMFKTEFLALVGASHRHNLHMLLHVLTRHMSHPTVMACSRVLV